jgi:hypothetical protein
VLALIGFFVVPVLLLLCVEGRKSEGIKIERRFRAP